MCLSSEMLSLLPLAGPAHAASPGAPPPLAPCSAAPAFQPPGALGLGMHVLTQPCPLVSVDPYVNLVAVCSRGVLGRATAVSEHPVPPRPSPGRWAVRMWVLEGTSQLPW